MMQAYLYRWKLLAGRESEFVAAWSSNTVILKALGSLGSRLHAGSDGWWYAYAQWPDADARAQAFATASDHHDYVDATNIMRGAIAESLPAVALDMQADFLTAAL